MYISNGLEGSFCTTFSVYNYIISKMLVFKWDIKNHNVQNIDRPSLVLLRYVYLDLQNYPVRKLVLTCLYA